MLRGRQMTLREFEDLGQTLPTASGQMYQVAAIREENGRLTCQRCHNQDAFATIPESHINYCIHCLSLGRLTTEDTLIRFKAVEPKRTAQSYLTWQGTLSPQQEQASQFLVGGYQDKSLKQLIHAVTGAGKTEMIFRVIDRCLMEGGRVALVSPRIDVCLELEPRIQEAFKGVDVLTMYGQMTETYRHTPIVIATVHQLWKFYQAFDLIIVDEIDAFPLKGDPHLHFAINNALQPSAKLIYLTATPDAFIEKELKSNKMQAIVLPARFHRKPLVEPKFIWINDWKMQITHEKKGQLLKLITRFIAIEGVKLLFMPDIQYAEKLLIWLRKAFPQKTMEAVHAQDTQRKDKVNRVRQGQTEVLITTTILERGVTFANCHVLIIGSEDSKYSASALIQMSGRVGRKPPYTSGSLIFGHYGISRRMLKARREIRRMNQIARESGLIDET